MINDPQIFLPIDPRKINLSLDPLSLCRNIVNCTRLFFQHTFLSIFLNDSSSNKHRSVRTSEASTKLTLAIHPLSSVSSNSMPLARRAWREKVGGGWVRQFNQPITRTASRDRSRNIPNQSSCNPFQCPLPSKPLKFFLSVAC